MILSARIAILDPVLLTIFFKKIRILNAFPMCLTVLFLRNIVISEGWDGYRLPLQKWVSHQFPGCSLHFRGVFRIISHSCSAFPGSTLFPDALNVILESRLLRLLLLLLLLFANYSSTWPWVLALVLRVVRMLLDLRSEINAMSWHCCVGDDCKWFCLPELQSLILCSWLSFSKKYASWMRFQCVSQYCFWETL